ncbi:histone acetyltransferase, partial [Aureobasidium melanogenum]
MHDIRGSLDVIFQMRHEVCAVTFDLLIAAYSAEDDFGELAALERAICDAAHNFEGLFDDGHGKMSAIVDETGNVVLGHLRQLFLEDTFEAGQDDVALVVAIVVDSSELDLAVALFDDGGFLGKGVGVGEVDDLKRLLRRVAVAPPSSLACECPELGPSRRRGEMSWHRVTQPPLPTSARFETPQMLVSSPASLKCLPPCLYSQRLRAHWSLWTITIRDIKSDSLQKAAIRNTPLIQRAWQDQAANARNTPSLNSFYHV